MADILHFFSSYSILIYLLLIIGLMFAFRRWIRARSEMSGSLYGLEREIAYRHTSQAVAAIFLIVFLAIAELILIVFLVPNLPAFSLLITPTLNPLLTPINTVPPELLANSRDSTRVSTATAQTIGCIPGQIMITSPKPGGVVRGQVILVGTANIPNFGFYKYEFSPMGTEVWSTIQANREVKQDVELGPWDTSEVSPGDYDLRLVVVNSQGDALPPCVVPVRVATP
jgi:hypothetical protein